MKATYDGLEYHIFLDSDNEELERLFKDHLCGYLINAGSEFKIGKSVNLRLGNARHKNGIDFHYTPRRSKKLKDAKGIDIIINKTAYDLLHKSGQLISSGKGYKVRIDYWMH